MQLKRSTRIMEGKKQLLCLLVLVLKVSKLSLSDAAEESEAEALLQWKHSLKESYPELPLLKSWQAPNASENGSGSPCSWDGIKCNDAGSVIRISLRSKGLQGTLHTLSFLSLKSLAVLDLGDNDLYGNLQNMSFSTSSLTYLSLRNNYFNGTLENLTHVFPQGLTYLDLSHNFLHGSIPLDIGRALPPNLSYLNLSWNSIESTIPSSLGNISLLSSFDASNNVITGSLLLSNLTELIYLSLDYNRLTGVIIPEISNSAKLQSLYMRNNLLSGSIPEEIGGLQYLKYLELSDNDLSGPIPPAIGNLSMLQMLSLYRNDFSGKMPTEIRTLHSLRILRLQENSLNGSIPSEIMDLKGLTELSLGCNNISGSVAQQVGSLLSLVLLNLSDNHLTGEIPSSIGMIPNLNISDLSKNHFSGAIPPQIGFLSQLTFLDLSTNNLAGPIPLRLESCKLLQNLDLSKNRLSGKVPAFLITMYNLNLDLSHNHFTGHVFIPFDRVVHSSCLINLSYNNLYITLPFEDAIPPADVGSQGLRNETEVPKLEVPPPQKNLRTRGSLKLAVSIAVPLFILILILPLVIVLLWKSLKITSIGASIRRREISIMNRNNRDLFSIWNYDGKVVFDDIIEATENFNDIYCIGAGANGCVYEAELPTGQIVAVKKFHSLESGEPVDEHSSRNEIRILTKIRHRNIVKLYGFCLHSHCMFLVYEYMESGSLAGILSDNSRAIEFDWDRRVNAVRGMADALSYMHHDCMPAMVHRDITNKNILFDSEFKACISDFGTARLLKPDSSIWTSIAGTCGYIAPGMHFELFKI